MKKHAQDIAARAEELGENHWLPNASLLFDGSFLYWNEPGNDMNGQQSQVEKGITLIFSSKARKRLTLGFCRKECV